MSDKAKAAQQARWANVTPEERARLGKIHGEAMKQWWSTISDEEKSARGYNMAVKKYAKKS